MNNATHTDESLCLYDANMYAKSTAFYTKRAVRVAANANRTDGMRHDGAPELLPSGYSLAAECQHAKEDDENWREGPGPRGRGVKPARAG